METFIIQQHGSITIFEACRKKCNVNNGRTEKNSNQTAI